jgi:FkbM family methyltransferase
MALVLPGPLRRALPGWLVQPLRRLLWRLPNLRRQLPSGLDLVVESPSDWTIYNDIFAEGEYDEALQIILAAAPLDRPLRVLDLGANVGYFVLRLADRALRPPALPFEVLSVEASKPLVRTFERRLLSQPALVDRVRVAHGLVGRQRAGVGHLYESSLHFEHSSLPRGGRRVAVGFVDLLEHVQAWPEIDLLKCDIEGAELDFVAGYASDLIPRVRRAVVELHHDRCDTGRCLSLFEAAGFRQEATLREAFGCSVVLLSRQALP